MLANPAVKSAINGLVDAANNLATDGPGKKVAVRGPMKDSAKTVSDYARRGIASGAAGVVLKALAGSVFGAIVNQVLKSSDISSAQDLDVPKYVGANELALAKASQTLADALFAAGYKAAHVPQESRPTIKPGR